MRGASRAFSEWGRCGARGREGTLLAHSGGAGAPPGDTTVPCQELADGGPLRLARGSEGTVDPKGAASFEPEARRNGTSESAARRCHDAAMERREAPAFPKRERGTTKDWCAAWRSIPLAFCGGEKREVGVPRAVKE